MIEEIEDDEEETLQASSIGVYFKILEKILTDLDPEYWMKYTGFDGKIDSFEGTATSCSNAG